MHVNVETKRNIFLRGLREQIATHGGPSNSKTIRALQNAGGGKAHEGLAGTSWTEHQRRTLAGAKIVVGRLIRVRMVLARKRIALRGLTQLWTNLGVAKQVPKRLTNDPSLIDTRPVRRGFQIGNQRAGVGKIHARDV